MIELSRRAQPLLGTFVEIAVPAVHDAAHDNAMDAAFAAIRDVHMLMSFHESQSDVSRINRAAPGEAIQCDRRTIDVVRLAIDLYRQSGGLFDITTASRLVRDGFLPKVQANPLRNYRGGVEDIEILDDTHMRIHQSLLVDLGGIAKGYAVDKAIDALHKAGVPSAMVNAGGDLRYYGEEAWPVHLRRADGSVGKELNLPACAIASSSNDLSCKRRLFGVVTPHIGPDNRPIRLDHTVTVVASRCVIADAMTKIAMTDTDLANSLLERYDGFVVGVGPDEESLAA